MGGWDGEEGGGGGVCGRQVDCVRWVSTGFQCRALSTAAEHALLA